MLKAEKERIVAELVERLKSTPTLFVADYRGLSVTEIDDLRTKLIEAGARFTVVKNTLTKRAAEEAGADALLALLDGPTAIAFIEAEGDMVAVAKALADSARTTKILAIRGGILDGAPIGEEEVKSLATLPSLDVLRGQVLGAIIGPLTTVVGLISAPVRDLIGLIDARIEQLREQGDTSEAGVEPVAEAAPAEPEGQTPEGSVPEPAAETAATDEEGLTPEGSDPGVSAEEPATEEEPAAEEPVAEGAPAEPEGQTPEGSVPEPAAETAATDEEGLTPEGSDPGVSAEEPATEEEPAAEEPVAEATTEETGETEEAAEETKEES